jgi:plastocyanin
MSVTNPQSSQGSTAVAVVVAVLIIGAVATLGYYQFAIAPNQLNSTTTTSTPAVTCPGPGCGNISISAGAGTPLSGYTTGFSGYGYSPDTAVVIIGQNNTVVWTNNDAADHTVTSSTVPAGAQTFDSGLISPSGGTFQVTFTVPGTYIYHCTLHTWMWGKIIVLAGSGSTATSSSSATTASSSTTTTTTTT